NSEAKTNACPDSSGRVTAATSVSANRRQFVRLESQSEVLLRELADAGLGDLVDEGDVVGQPPLGDLAVEELDDLGRRGLLALLEDDAGQRALLPLRVLDADDGGLGHLGVAHDLVLELD